MKMNRSIAITLALSLIFILIAGVYLVNYFSLTSSQASTACFKENCFDVELATTPQQQVQGLSNRDSLPASKGMLFVFENEGLYPFWMKDMRFPLDIIWLAKNGTIVFVERNALPCTATECVPIKPRENAKYVLEVNAGIANSTGLKVGEKVEINV